MSDNIESLLQKLDEYEHAYYNDEPLIDDAAYDAFKDRVYRQLPPNHPRMDKVGHAICSEWPKKKHVMPMGSQNKLNSEKEIREWVRKVFRDLGISYASFVLQHKIDGFSLETLYENEKLDSAQTRGDGFIGENIIENARLFRQLPQIISRNSAAVRAEGVLFKSDYEYVQKERTKEGKESYKNARNAASGISRRQDGKFSKYIQAIAYDTNHKVKTEMEKIKYLNDLGFSTVKTYICYSEDEIISIYNQYKNDLRKTLPYEIDGLVLKLNDIEFQERLGVQHNRPEGQVALKFDSEQVVTTVNEFKLQVGKSGRITPVAILEPVDLMGSTITKASVHNFALMAEIGIGVGSEVVIEKKGDIIPQVTDVMTEGLPIEIPSVCPSCGGPVTNDDVNIWCFNKDCREREINRIVYWIKSIGMKGFSQKFIEKLWEMNKIRSVYDLYKLTTKDFILIEGIGDKTIASFFESIDSTLEMYLENFITALGILNCGKTVADILVENFKTWDKISSLIPSDLEQLPGFAEISAANVCTGLASVKDMADGLIKIIRIKEKKQGLLTGMSFCVTGSLSSMGRKEFQEFVVDHGGITKNSVGKGLTYLVTNDKESGSNKNKQAQKYGVSIINEDEFFNLANGI
jgi:DNA ligase (NAD+)